MKQIIVLLLSIILFLLASDTICEEIYSFSIDSCTLSLERERKWETLTIRISHPQLKECTVPEKDFYTFLDNAFTNLADKNDTVVYKSIFMGRIIKYPWMSRLLADSAVKDTSWSNEKGKHGDLHTHQFVEGILNNKEILGHFNEKMAITGYTVNGVSVEKVLISRGTMRNLPDWIDPAVRVPFDAMVWFKLEKL
jgi:hypothetical protein